MGKPQPWVSDLTFELKDDYEAPCRALDGKAVTIIGGGPSLSVDTVNMVEPFPHITTNNSYQLVKAPTLHVSLDRRYFDWHGQGLAQRGFTIVTALRENQHIKLHRNQYHRMKKDREANFPPDKWTLTGTNSGHAAIALAIVLGAKTIYLAGFDMGFPEGKTHWHDPHPVPPSESNYTTRFRPRLESLVNEAAQAGVEIAAITPTMADIRRASLEEALTRLSS